jgi:phosphoglucomutase
MGKSIFAGQIVPESLVVNIDVLLDAYASMQPDAKVPEERVEFGTSGHRGSSLRKSFNEHHILVIAQAIALYRQEKCIDGPLFLGIDTHALSLPAMKTTLEVLAANGVHVYVAQEGEYTPTPVISHAILTYNQGRSHKLADGIVITPSHNPPDEGGIKYNPPHGGPADSDVTTWIQQKANALLEGGLESVRRIPFDQALEAITTQRYDFMEPYVADLKHVIDMEAIRGARIHLGVDPLGGASVHYWKRIAEVYGLDLQVTNESVDPAFRFMTVDWDGKVRMDPSSSDAMGSLLAMRDQFDIAFACDTDADRHGIVTKAGGLLSPNHFLSVAVAYLFQHRPAWSNNAAVAKTVVTSDMLDRIATKFKRQLYAVPVGFKWFVDGLLTGRVAFAGEESAGAAFVRIDGSVWTTDKDGIIMCLLAAEITAQMGKDPAVIYKELTQEFGDPAYARVDAPATSAQKAILKNLDPSAVSIKMLAGEEILSIITHAPGNGAAIGGLRVSTATGWFAARPSGTEDIYKIYGESFKGQEHLQQIFADAQAIVDQVLAKA